MSDTDTDTAYLKARAVQHDKRAAEMVAALTPREAALVKEVAVMAFVRGKQHHDVTPHPKDSAVLFDTLLACDSFSDLYPTVAALGEEAEVEYVPHFTVHEDGHVEQNVPMADD